MQPVQQLTQTPFHASRWPSLASGLLELVWPTRCVGCETPGQLLCERCNGSIARIEIANACPRCGAPHGRLICTECCASESSPPFSFARAACAMEMGPVAGRMVVVYKDGDERRLANYCAAELLAAIPPSWWQWADCLTWIPSDKRSLRRRGFSPIRLIAHKLSALVEVPAQALLKKSPTKDQRHLGRSGRRANLLGCFSLLDATERPFPGGSGRSLSLETARCGSGHSLPDKVVLIDDVFTTGATLDSAAAQLCEGGVSEVRVATLVRVW